MRIAILNWSDGENDPFSFFNQQFRQQLVDLGHDVIIVPLNAALGTTMQAIQGSAPVDFVLTWQGLGSARPNAAASQTLWAQLDLPVVCLHGDHPCYNPPNHQPSSHHLLHVYPVPAFARDANRFIPRDWPALFEPLPNFFQPDPAPSVVHGEFFVFPKNLTDLVDIRRAWQQRCDEATYRLLCAGADAIEQAYRDGNTRDHHEVILDTLPSPIPERVRAGQMDAATANLVFGLGRELDQVHRNVASAYVLEALPEVPIQVYGRGWDRFKARGNPNHQFHAFGRVEQGDSQFQSAYGILDIAPQNGTLHDRTFRAMRKGAGFLVSSAWRHDEPIHQEFAELFFSGAPGELAARVNRVRQDPDGHRARVRMFAEVFDAVFPMASFVDRIRYHAAARGFSLPL
jgi:hypothetical protein